MNAIFTFLILIGLIVLGFWLVRKFEYKDTEWLYFVGILVIVISVILLTLHSVFSLTVTYEYNHFVAERKAFETTLNEVRSSGNQYEAAAITKDIAMWNTQLASLKYNNSTFILGQYVDDRVKTLNPIK